MSWSVTAQTYTEDKTADGSWAKDIERLRKASALKQLGDMVAAVADIETKTTADGKLSIATVYVLTNRKPPETEVNEAREEGT
jgi:hypothetical protein